ncbi:hypothetical protein CspHIS471_0504560 [Cutaneotrichosporon sp. HIS471]|nr:hypothetical protein CspHIS471_0504560 [Cutaneotrichosporon sp. HIS471]
MPPRPAVPQNLLRQPLRALATASASTSSVPFAGLPPLAPASTKPTLPTTMPDAIRMLRETTTSSKGIYCVARLHSRTYLLHPRDVLTLPTLKPMQAPGTTLALTRILEVGGREYAIRSPAADGKELRKSLLKGPGVDASFEIIPPWIATCELTVLEHTKSPLTRTLLKKRRKGYQKTIQNKQGWTRLRVGDIVLGSGIEPSSEQSS